MRIIIENELLKIMIIMNNNTKNFNEIKLKKPKAISVLSGGLDSTVATSVFSKSHKVHAITFDYGQKSLKQEIKSSKEICEEFNIEHTILNIKWLADLGDSALTLKYEKIPEINMADLENKNTCVNNSDKVMVPGRNMVFTAIATSFAEAEGAEIIIVGWNNEEAATFPDTSKEFLNSFNETINNSSKNHIEIKAPIIDLNKKEIVELGKKFNAPMELSYSCYLGEDIHCGKCESCVRRKRAFFKSNVEDKTDYLE